MENFPVLAKRYSIDVSGYFVQLPIVVLLKNGNEIVRYPANDKNGKPMTVKHYKEKEIIKNFDLENIYLNTKK